MISLCFNRRRRKVAEMTNKAPGGYPFWSIHSVRLRVVFVVCFGVLCQGMMKTDINMAMVCMVNHTAFETPEPSSGSTQCPSSEIKNNNTRVQKEGDLLWSSEDQAWIFSIFYWGGLVSVIAYSRFPRFIGPSRAFLYGAIINVIGSFLTPVAATRGGVYCLMVIRFAMGFGQGILLTTAAAIVAVWVQLNEKSTASAIYTAGNQVSTIVSMFLTSQLCQLSFLNGWPSIFYLNGIIGSLFCVVWAIFIRDDPSMCKGISDRELEHISGKRGVMKATATPWSKILTSLVVWAMVFCTFAQLVITVSLTTYLPLYLKMVLKMNLTANGIWSAMPFICQLLSKVVFGQVADTVKRRWKKALDPVTKLCNSIASFGAAICLIGVSFLSCGQSALAVALLSAAMCLLSGYIPGYFTCLLTVAPPYTAEVNAFTWVFGQIGSIVTPYIIGFLTKQNTVAEWRTVFYIIASVLLASGLFFVIFGSAKPQTWAQQQQQSVSMEKRCSISTIPVALNYDVNGSVRRRSSISVIT